MKWISLPPACMAAICFSVAFYYFLMYFKIKEEKVNLTFAICCITVGLYDICCAGLYNSESLVNSMFWQRLQFASLALFSGAILWFVYYFGNYKYKKPFNFLTAVISVFFVLGFAVNNELTLSLARPLRKHVKLGDLINITYNEVDPGIIYLLQYILMITGFIYLLYKLIQLHKYGRSKQSRPILIAMIFFFLIAINDVLVGAGVYPFIFLFEYGFMVIIFSMSYVLTNEFVELHEEVQELNRHLEEKVKERTIDLLLNEAGTSLYVELQNEFLGVEKIGEENESISRLIDEKHKVEINNLSREPLIVASFDELLNRVILKILNISGAKTGYIFINNEKNELELKVPPGIGNKDLAEYCLNLVNQVYKTGEHLISSSLKHCSAADSGETGSPEEKSIMAVPIKVSNETIGVCYLEDHLYQEGFTPGDAKIIIAFISQVSDAIGTALLYKRIKDSGAMDNKSNVTSYTEEKIKKAIEYISENYTYDISREGLAASLDINPDHLGKAFKQYTGKRIGEFINEIRVKEAAQKLIGSNSSVIDIAFSVGFESLRTFNRVFLKIMKETPNKYREQK